MPAWLVVALARYGYIALFVGVFLENLGIPVPGETVLLAAGFLARQQVLRLPIVILSAMVAAILGDNFGYWIGRRAGRAFVERHGKFIGLTPNRLAAVDAYFRRHGPKTIFFARFISGIRVFAALFAGISRVEWRTFVLYNAAGAVVWSTTMGILGYVFGQSWRLLERWIGRSGLVFIALVGFVLLFALLWRYRGQIVGAVGEWLPGRLTVHEAWLLLVNLVAVGLFGKITEDVVTHEASVFDLTVSEWISQAQWIGLRPLMLLFNALGSGLAVVGAIVVALVWRMRARDHAGRNVLIALAVTTQALDALLKLVFHRIRPEPLHALTHVYTGSFPSGHAINAVAIYGFIGVLLARNHAGWGRVCAVLVTILALGIGVARVYLQLHWPTDVLAGYAVGLLLLITAVFWLDRTSEVFAAA
jgi:membrane protein DedA with SNARE-associated domain/membrane-associated phospholipid phosphatase